jgi:hypothetical protein
LCGIGDVGACALARALCTNVHITQVDLQKVKKKDENLNIKLTMLKKNEIGDLGAMGLALALKRNPVLTQLDLDYNNSKLFHICLTFH